MSTRVDDVSGIRVIDWSIESSYQLEDSMSNKGP